MTAVAIFQQMSPLATRPRSKKFPPAPITARRICGLTPPLSGEGRLQPSRRGNLSVPGKILAIIVSQHRTERWRSDFCRSQPTELPLESPQNVHNAPTRSFAGGSIRPNATGVFTGGTRLSPSRPEVGGRDAEI